MTTETGRPKILILEDNDTRFSKMLVKLGGIAHVTRTETAAETITALQNSSFDILSLDHDLGGQEMVYSGVGTGYEVAQWLAAHQDRSPNIVWLHTLNPVGRDNMKALLPSAMVMPFWWESK